MRLKNDFESVLNRVFSELDKEEQMTSRGSTESACAILADVVAKKIMCILADNELWEIRELFQVLETLVKGGRIDAALYTVCLLFKILDYVEVEAMITGFISGTEWEECFMESLISKGYEHCIMQCIGLEY